MISSIVLLSAAISSGCAEHEDLASASLETNAEGYALIAVDVVEGQSFDLAVTLDGADTGWALLYSEEEAPAHVGWFDAHRWTNACEMAGTSLDDPDGAHAAVKVCALAAHQCTGRLMDECDVGAGYLVATKAQTVAAGEPVRYEHRGDYCGDEVCTYYYAIIAGRRLDGRHPFTVEVTTSSLRSDDAPPSIRAVEPGEDASG